MDTTTEDNTAALAASSWLDERLQERRAAPPRGADWLLLLAEQLRVTGGQGAPRIDVAKFTRMTKGAADSKRRNRALWCSVILPSGHSGESAEVLIKLAIDQLSLIPDGELMELGRTIVFKADLKFRDGGMSWESFILQRLRWKLPSKIRKLCRRNPIISIDRYVVRPPVKPGAATQGRRRVITLDLEDMSKYSAETLEEIAQARKQGYKIWRSSVEDQLMIDEGTVDNQQRLVDQIFRGLSPEDRNILGLAHGLNGNGEHSLAELAERIGDSKTTAHRRVESAKARARDEILLPLRKLAELTGTTDPAQQMAVLQCLEVYYEPPKHWLRHSRDGERLRTGDVRERGIKPMVIWLSDVRYLLSPARIEHLDRKLTAQLGALMNKHVPLWQQDSHRAEVETIHQALECLARLRAGKFTLD